jgi:hypothetical protein
VILGAAGCGNAPTTQAPSSRTTSSSPTPSASATSASPSPTETARPLSPYEARPQVKVIRKWAAGFGRSVNDNDHAMTALAPVVTGDPKRFASYVSQEFGLFYPGPLPLTPTGVRVSGPKATVPTCVWSGGWGQKRSTHLPATKRAIIPVDVFVKKVGGAWKVDGAQQSRRSCSDVPVKGVAW